MTDLSPTEREAMQAFQEQEWTPVPVPPIGGCDDWHEWPITPCGILPVAPEDLVIGFKVTDPNLLDRFVGCGFQLSSLVGKPTEDGEWTVRAVFSPIPPHLRQPFDAGGGSGED